MKNRVTAALLLTAWSWTPSAQAEVKIKMGTLAPDGSTWHQALQRIRDKWSEASGGEVRLTIFAGGVQGDEADTVRKMRINQLQAAALTAVGLRDISPDPQAVCTPMMITSYPELDFVMGKVSARLEQSIADKGFVVLTWTDTGMMYFFSRNPAPSPKEAFPQKVFAYLGDPVAEEAWRTTGFTPVVLSPINVIPSLQTGMVDAFTTTPLIALTMGWYRSARNVTMTPWGMLVGALVISRKAWDKVPAALQPKLLEIARKEGDALKPEARRQESESLRVMEEKGLKLVRPDPGQMAQWSALAPGIFSVVRGKVVPEAIFDDVRQARDEFRRNNKRL